MKNNHKHERSGNNKTQSGKRAKETQESVYFSIITLKVNRLHSPIKAQIV
jgi:hypothetical protein